MKVAECRFKDPNCAYSKGLSAALVDAIKEGKSENDAVAAATASRSGHAPGPAKLLDPPVRIETQGSPVIGPADAPITLIEFSDFQCPYCVKAVGQLKIVLNAYPKQVKLVFRQFPLDSHSQAAYAASAALAAHNQGKFWQMHDALFANRSTWAADVLRAGDETRSGYEALHGRHGFGGNETHGGARCGRWRPGLRGRYADTFYRWPTL